ncbi:ECF transporter S component [Floricoccus tropicus]|uniref:ECF transporter S component n=1 Tax=Floricoccus tropicus TaxID=1859473 RepID=UPI001E4BF98C|nr:ECF transporter S component [Floricoccus tropicus]
MIKIFGSIALDSCAAFVGSVILNPQTGFVLGFIGHLISAFLAGFPLTLPVHIVVGLCMGICSFVFGLVRGRSDSIFNFLFASLLAYIINVPFSLLIITMFLGWSVWAFFVPLSIATLVNLLIAEIVIRFFNKGANNGKV